MRFFLNCVAFATLALANQRFSANACAETATTSEKSGDTKACVMQFGGHDVLRLTVPADTECVTNEGSLKLSSQHRAVQLWLVKDAKSVKEAVGRVKEEIKDEFKEFKVTKSSDLTIAGTQAKRQEGSGEEADDGDPGQADVIIFKMGKHIFVACVHGEKLNAEAQEWMLKLLKSAREK